MAYTPQTWADEPSQTTPINATRLTHIETGLQTAASVADAALPTATASATYVPRLGGSTTNSAALPFFNVKDYGALGNASNNDTTAIQAALNAAAAATYGGTVWFPPGDYRISSALTLNASNVMVLGAGAQLTTITSTSTTADVFTLGTGASLFGLHFAGLSITTTVTKTAGAAFKCTDVNRSSFVDVNLYKMFTGYQLVSGANVWIDQGFWGDFVPTTGTGLLVQGGNDQYVRGIVAECPVGSAGATAVEVQASGGSLTISDCDFIRFYYGMWIHPASGVTVNWLWVTSVAFDTCSQNGIYIAPATGGIVYGLCFTQCWTSSSGADGVLLGGSGTLDTVRFTAHRSLNNVGHGFSWLHGVNVSIIDSDISGNSAGSAGTNQGIYIAPGMVRGTIANCRIRQMMAYSNTQANGIFLDSGATDYVMIVNNDVDTNNLATITNFATGTHNKVMDNIGYNPRGVLGPPTVPATTVAYTNAYGVDCEVNVNGGTVTVVAINGSSTGRTSGPFQVRAGQTITLTYSAAPTWTWFGN